MTKPLLITVNGTGIPDPYGPGFSGDIGRALQTNPWQIVADKLDGIVTPPPLVEWQPIGYPAAVANMGASVLDGAYRKPSPGDGGGVVAEIQARPVGTPLFLSGYSQGALVTATVWRDAILNPSGILHNRLQDVKGIIQFGDPMRCPGIAHGNEVAGFPLPRTLDGATTGGIAGGDCLTAAQTPDFYLSCALDGDLYAAAPVGDDPWHNEAKAGQVETQIFKIVQQATFGDIIALAKDLGRPIATVEAIWNALKFFAEGTAAAHWQYGPFIPALVDWILARI